MWYFMLKAPLYFLEVIQNLIDLKSLKTKLQIKTFDFMEAYRQTNNAVSILNHRL